MSLPNLQINHENYSNDIATAKLPPANSYMKWKFQMPLSKMKIQFYECVDVINYFAILKRRKKGKIFHFFEPFFYLIKHFLYHR